ncbi:BON domain-containing protein [Frigidibacter sp. SD6-1]|uniref:BON domain-containing protein n=1 Tax=Frigidibacter sp. SD6-1 TaxID=3032581 RepID=UPI0024DFABB1|nr:BON domain-containing protein [Frigidibacter sp. SD6-1]
MARYDMDERNDQRHGRDRHQDEELNRGHGNAQRGYGSSGEGRDYPAARQARHEYDRDDDRGRGYGQDQTYADGGEYDRRAGRGQPDYRRQDYGRRDRSGDWQGGGQSDWRSGGRGTEGWGGGRMSEGLSRQYGSQDYGDQNTGGGLGGGNWSGDDQGRHRRLGGDGGSSGYGGSSGSRNGEMAGQGHRGKGPKNYSRSDERITEDVNDRLQDDDSLDATEIEVSVSGGEATLSGTVGSRQDKRRAEDCAESVSGISHVQNNLRVKQSPGSSQSGSSSDNSASKQRSK